MFRQLRRGDRALTPAACEALLNKCRWGVLSTAGAEGWPYGVPLCYAYENGVLYFHAAAAGGYKLDSLRRNDRASFTVVGETEVLPAAFALNYESVIVFGRVSPAVDKAGALAALAEKYSPGEAARARAYAEGAGEAVCALALTVEHMSGKARRSPPQER